MTRWKKDEKMFEVKVTNDYAGSRLCRIPKPIIEMLGNPDSIKFEIQGKKIVVFAVDSK